MSAAPFTMNKALRVIAASRPEGAADPGADWRAGLLRKKNGDPKAHHANVDHVLRNHPDFLGMLGWDEFRLKVIILRETPWGSKPGTWTDKDDVFFAEWLQREEIDVRPDVVGQAVGAVAHDEPRHVVVDYLAGLKWDGVPRIDRWLTCYLGVEETPYSRAVGAKWLISAVARIIEPGCKVDTCLILEGKQGLGKSRALKVLAGEWFTDSMPDLHSKDAALQTAGAWIIELAELDTLTRSDVGTTKAFMSRSTDRYRPPYGKNAIDAPRQCVFAGTVNESAYLKDSTGARRFWPVLCGEAIDLVGLERDRDQIWGEAVQQFRALVPWWLDEPELVEAAAEEQASRFEGHPWQGTIETWLEGQSSVTIARILQVCIDKPKERWTQPDQNNVARCLQALGWERYRFREGGQLAWGYRPKEN